VPRRRSVAGVSGLYHTFAFSGKIKESKPMMLGGRLISTGGEITEKMLTMRQFLVVCLLLISQSCHPQSSKNSQSDRSELVVAAAANLTDAFAEVGPRFTSETGIPVVFSFGATADLTRQIENGAPFDVFAAADTAHVDLLERKGLITPGTRALYARGRLVMWLPPGSILKAAEIGDITAKEFERVAIANPDIAPYGQATVESLRALGIWNQIESKVIYAQSVSQTKQYAATGNVEVAFIPLALVKPGEGTYIEVNEESHQPINQALGIVKDSSKQAAARQFVDFLLSMEGQELLSRNGYSKPRVE
jgi:molybdate transport system substrate-binding protein